MKAMERRRVRQALTMVQLEELAGLSEGYYNKMLHAEMPDGRQSSWSVLQRLVDVLWPDGRCRVKLTTVGPDNLLTAASILKLNENLRTYYRGRLLALAESGGRARAKSLTPRERQAIAKMGATARWNKFYQQRAELAEESFCPS